MKKSMFRHIRKHDEKKLTKESKAAAEAMRRLYPDQSFLLDFEKLLEITREELLGKEEVEETVRARTFPDGTAGFILKDLAENERRSAYQEAGGEMGKARKKLVSVFASRLVEENMVMVNGMTPDGRECGALIYVLRDAKGRIQKVEKVTYREQSGSKVGVFAGMNGELSSLVVGYTHALRDEVLKGVIGDLKAPI